MASVLRDSEGATLVNGNGLGERFLTKELQLKVNETKSTRFADRNELRAHLEAEKLRDQTASEPDPT